MMYRRIRTPITETELDLLRGKLRSAEFSLNSATAAQEALRKEIAQRDQAIAQAGEDLKERLQQIDQMKADVEAAAAQRGQTDQRVVDAQQKLAEADERIKELSMDADSLREQRKELEAKLKDMDKLKEADSAFTEKASKLIADYEAQIEANKRQIQDLAAQVVRLTTEYEGQFETDKTRIEALNEQVARLTAESSKVDGLNEQVARLTAESSQIQALNEQIIRLTAESSELAAHTEEETRERQSLEAALNAELERSRQLNVRLAELENEKSQFDRLLDEERQSAAKGMELLLMAQQNLSRVFKQGNGDAAPNGKNGHAAAPEALTAPVEEEVPAAVALASK